MNLNSVSSHIGQSAVNSRRDFCVSLEDLRKNRTDGIKVVVPERGIYYGMAGIEQCWNDTWGETCSLQDRFWPAATQNNSSERSCVEAQKEDPERFESMRGPMESGYNWTLTEMRRSMRWIFNCTGKIPVKDCAMQSN